MENGKKFYVSQVDDFKHVDSTGAGDAFLAGFIYGVSVSVILSASFWFGV